MAREDSVAGWKLEKHCGERREKEECFTDDTGKMFCLKFCFEVSFGKNTQENKIIANNFKNSKENRMSRADVLYIMRASNDVVCDWRHFYEA